MLFVLLGMGVLGGADIYTCMQPQVFVQRDSEFVISKTLKKNCFKLSERCQQTLLIKGVKNLS